MSAPRSSLEPKSSWSTRFKRTGLAVFNHLKKHTGVGIVCAVAYFDPGNWGVDLQAGSEFGYRLLFVVLLAGLFAVFLQVQASRMGCVTGLDLASHCRALLYDRPKHKKLYRWLGLYPLYVLAETAIISTDLAELLGSAIALCLLFPKLQLWQGVLITAFDVIFILAMGDPLRGRPVRTFELLIASLVFAVLICMAILISKVEVDWGDAFKGYVPSKYIFQNGGLYISVGIVGATVMPHSIFLGSSLATQDRISSGPTSTLMSKPMSSQEKVTLEPTLSYTESTSHIPTESQSLTRRVLRHLVDFVKTAFRVSPVDEIARRPDNYRNWQNNSLEFVKAHVYHGIIDVAISLLGFAVLINSLILILASSVFFYGEGSTGSGSPAGLFDAFELLQKYVGKAAAILFAIALLAAGQSSSIIATVAGQAVSEGFLKWRVSPVVRRLMTRLLAVIPSMTVAIAVGRPGIDALLVISQVILSIVLPFITFPLLYVTSSRKMMSVRARASPSTLQTGLDTQLESGEQIVDFSSGWLATIIGFTIWLIVLTANMYVIVTLAMGQGG